MIEARSESFSLIFVARVRTEVPRRRVQAGHAFFKDEAPYGAIMRFRLGPNDEDVGDGRVGDPHLRAGQAVAAVGLDRAGAHAAGVGAGIGLGQAEAADEGAAGESREIFLALLLRAVSVDRVHDERALDRHGRAVAAIDALHGAGDEAVADIAEAGAAIFRRNGRAKQAEFAHFGENGAVEILFEISVRDARLQLVLGVGLRGVADEPFLVGQLMVQIERIRPVEGQEFWLGHLLSPRF